MLKRLFCLSTLVILLALPSLAPSQAIFTRKVVGVSDGDIIKVMRQGRTIRIHLHGIDCPEKKQPSGKKVKQFTLDKAFGKEVEVMTKITDRYGRLVGEVILPDGKYPLFFVAVHLQIPRFLQDCGIVFL
jgi:micrococcal nuclease